METLSIVLVMLAAVVVSGALSRMVPFNLPTPLIQIALGCAIGLVAQIRVDLNPELFFVLFLPPLLFLDGWRIPKDELFKDLPVVIELALGLVIFTVIGAGLFIHWLIPAMPLAVSFALAAIISPTDPIAVSAIAARVPIPKRMMHILEGESLLNDASGLVCFRFAVAAALTGAFSLHEAAASFVWMAVGGLVIGALTTIAITRAKAWVTRRYGEEIGSQILISLLIPFISYLVAEHFHCSGILAAVAAGVTMSFTEISRQTLAATRMRRNSVWDTIQFTANGAIFLLLGEQLPMILASAGETVKLSGHGEPWWLIVYIVAISLGLASLRFVWVWASFKVSMLRNTGTSPLKGSELRLVTAMSLAGVRGAITLAGVLTLPLTLVDGTAFPARDLAILIAAGVIVMSLAAASIGLPIILRGLVMPSDPSALATENSARVALAEAAIRRIESEQHRLAEGRNDADLYASVAAEAMDLYRARIESRAQEGEAAVAMRVRDGIGRDLRLAALAAERDELFTLARDRRIGSALATKLTREIDLNEARLRN
jgi:Na+/H+ antiporter